MALVRVQLLVPPRGYGNPGPEQRIAPSDGSKRVRRAQIRDLWMNPEDVSFVHQRTDAIPGSITFQRGQDPVYEGSIVVCQLHLRDQHLNPPGASGPGSENPLAIGNEVALRLKLQAGPRDLGLRVVLVSGTETTITGTILGPVKLKRGDHLCLDPAYLDSGGEWTISRPSGNNPRYEIQVGPNRAFNVQEKRAAAAPEDPPVWRRLSATVQPQAACTIRPEL